MTDEKRKIIRRYSNDESDYISFDLIDEHTVRRLVESGTVDLPEREIDIDRDEAWNMKQLNSRLLQGILNGDSIPKIADRLLDLVDYDESSAVRYARTMVTAAECGGRIDSYRELDSQGVVQRKVWMATPDERTRLSHVNIDGEEREIDELFSNDCMFPGDGNGPPEEVWNCRCSLVDHIIGFRRADGSISRIDVEPDMTMHEEQMSAERERRRANG